MSKNCKEHSHIKDIFESMEYGQFIEGKKLAEAWIEKHSNELGPFIDGKLSPNKPSFCMPAGDPGKVLKLHTGDYEAALQSTNAAKEKWTTLSDRERGKLLRSVARLLERDSLLIVQIEAISRGVLPRDPKETDVPVIIKAFYHYAGWPLQRYENCTFEPYGIVGGVLDINSPLASVGLMLAAALAAKNSVILLPHYESCLTSILLAQILTEAGIPPGVVNVVPQHYYGTENKCVPLEQINKFVIIGKPELARTVLPVQLTRTSTLLLSGCVPTIVLESADTDAAVDCVVDSLCVNQSKDPWTSSLVVVQEAVFDVVKKKLETRVRKLRMSGASDKMASASSELAAEKIAIHMKQVLHVNSVDGIARPDSAKADEWAPTFLFSFAPNPNAIMINGAPIGVSQVVSARSVKEAVTIANHCGSGLAASVWTENSAIALEVANQLQVGTVWINSHGSIDASVAMSSRARSGRGCFGGKEGFTEFIQLKKSNQVKKESNKIINIQKTLNPACNYGDVKYELFYGGCYKKPGSNAYYTFENVTGRTFNYIPDANSNEVRSGIEAAAKAQPAWGKRTAFNRSQILFSLANTFEKFSFSGVEPDQPELDAALTSLYFWASTCDKFAFSDAQTISGQMVSTMREPCGTIAVIWGSGDTRTALSDVVDIVASSLAYGNTCVLLVRPDCPVTVLQLGKVLEAAGLPAGVVNIMTCNSDSLISIVAAHLDISAVWSIGFEGNELQLLQEETAESSYKKLWVQDHHQTCNRVCESHASYSKAIWMPALGTFGN